MRTSTSMLVFCLGLLATAAVAAPPLLKVNLPSHQEVGTAAPILLTESPYSFDTTLANVRNAIKAGNFRMIREQQWDDGFAGSVGGRQRVLYFCNFALVHKAIHMDQRVGQFLPCRLTVMEQAGKVYIMAINPKAVSSLMDNPQLKPLCSRVEQMYVSVMEEATL